MDPTRAPEIPDLATARALISALQEQFASSQQEVVLLRHQLDVLCQRMFGKKSERVDPRELRLALEQLANEPGPVTEPIEMDSGETPVREHARRRPTGRRPLPAHLPRRRVEIEMTEERGAVPVGICARGLAKRSPRNWNTSRPAFWSSRPSARNTRVPTYLKDVLVRVATHSQQHIRQLTPKGWAQTFGAHTSV